ncbi:MAG: restriction endonuclease subunit S [Planctomycetaceae bacterium]|jgi:type I restriction enzyme S subunit|nr:restriction endonuclease subunit S [Planctomycetaceae bacterium]
MSSSDYRQTTIRTIAHINAHSVNGRNAPSHIEYIDISSVGTGELIDAPKAMSFADAPSRARRIVKAGDTILSTVRPNRRSFLYLSAPSSIAVASTGFAVLTPTEHVDARYLYYWVTRQDFTDYLSLHAKGAAYPAVSAEDIGNGEIDLPPLPIQRRIAGILSAYDELIENSQRRIKILESMARGLYREWFVHFRFPGHESVPRVKSPMGEIPKGWEVGRLDDVLVLQRGFDLPKASRIEGTVPIIAATGITGFHNEARAKAPGVVTGRSGTIGEVLYVQEDFWPLNTSLWVKEFPNSEPLYAFYLLSSLDLKQFNSGAAVPTLNRNDIHGTNVVVPPRSIQKRFQDFTGSMLAKSRTLDQQIQNLRRTRDLLLPRLLSGQINVETIGL